MTVQFVVAMKIMKSFTSPPIGENCGGNQALEVKK